jgi:hypothetical protein
MIDFLKQWLWLIWTFVVWFILVFIGILFYYDSYWVSDFQTNNIELIKVKYKSIDDWYADISKMEDLNLRDRDIMWAYYDIGNRYLVVKLSDTYYHYCWVPSYKVTALWEAWSPYDYYMSSLYQWQHDCREVWNVPSSNLEGMCIADYKKDKRMREIWLRILWVFWVFLLPLLWYLVFFDTSPKPESDNWSTFLSLIMFFVTYWIIFFALFMAVDESNNDVNRSYIKHDFCVDSIKQLLPCDQHCQDLERSYRKQEAIDHIKR